jgi:hypothetical protein
LKVGGRGGNKNQSSQRSTEKRETKLTKAVANGEKPTESKKKQKRKYPGLTTAPNKDKGKPTRAKNKGIWVRLDKAPLGGGKGGPTRF